MSFLGDFWGWYKDNSPDKAKRGRIEIESLLLSSCVPLLIKLIERLGVALRTLLVLRLGLFELLTVPLRFKRVEPKGKYDCSLLRIASPKAFIIPPVANFLSLAVSLRVSKIFRWARRRRLCSYMFFFPCSENSDFTDRELTLCLRFCFFIILVPSCFTFSNYLAFLAAFEKSEANDNDDSLEL